MDVRVLGLGQDGGGRMRCLEDLGLGVIQGSAWLAV
jgi:hypothetical protein